MTRAQDAANNILKQAASSKVIGGAYAVPDKLWAKLVQIEGLPKSTDAYSPLNGPYAGKSFIKASVAVKPGLGAAADVPKTLATDPFGLNFSAVTDFLNYAAWLLHPLNWLRLVEFVVGLLFTGVGIALLTKRTPGTVTRRLVSITPGGRTIRRIEGHRMGRREGQREAARMEARQKETYQARRNSAIEREHINLDARRTARQQQP